MSTEVKEVYPEVSPVPAYSTPPPQNGMYNKAMEGFQQPGMDQYQNPHSGMASPPPQQQFNQQPSFHQQSSFQQQPPFQQQNSFQQQPGQQYPQGQPQMAQMGHQQSYNSATSGAQRQYQTAIPLSSLNSSPAPVDCPSCGARALTRTHFENGNTTHAWAVGLFLTTCLCCIAYLINGTKDVVHKCGNCGVELAHWHRSGRTEVKLNA